MKYIATRQIKSSEYKPGRECKYCYDEIDDPLEDYIRPFRLELQLLRDTSEIQRIKDEIKEKYERVKKETNSNRKGKMLEDIISDLLSLVPRMKIVGTGFNSRIEEIDIRKIV